MLHVLLELLTGTAADFVSVGTEVVTDWTFLFQARRQKLIAKYRFEGKVCLLFHY